MSTQVLSWYDEHKRILPWRREAPDPYQVLLSEFMLQQTTVVTVKDYFERFTAKWPTVQDLANAPDDAVMAEWAGLGYYARARNLIKAARMIVDLEAFPNHSKDLAQLPGVGPYTAAAIAAIAFREPILPRDGNINRILSRVHNIDDAIDRPSQRLSDAALLWAHETRSGELAQALMDIGARICRPKNPNCEECPLQDNCDANMHGLTNALPVKAAKRAKKIWQAHAYVIRNLAGDIGYIERDANMLLGGMWALPTSIWEATPQFDPPIKGHWEIIGEVRHIFTHIDLTVTIHLLELNDMFLSNEIRFMSAAEMPKSSLARLWGKVLEKIDETRDK